MPVIVSPNIIVAPHDAAAAIAQGTPWILWENKALAGLVSAFPTPLAGYPASNLANPATNLEWRAADIGITYLGVTNPGSCNAVGIARHNFGSANIAIEIGMFNADASVWTPLTEPIMPANDEPLLFYFETQSAPGQVNVRLYAGDAAPRAAVLYMGMMLIMERSLDVNPDFAIPRFARRTEFQAGRSERGDYLGRIVTSQWVDGVEHVYKHITPVWYRENCDPFIRAAQQDVPFFYATLPLEYPYEVGFMWLQDDPIALTNPATRRINMTLRMGGILE